jgi:hypothetical protein
VSESNESLPGFMERAAYMREKHGKSDFTGKRWQDRGLLVVRYFGRTPHVDLIATAERARREERRTRTRTR